MNCEKIIDRLIPLMLIFIILWMDITYIIIFCMKHVENEQKRIIFLIIVHILLFLFFWCLIYVRTSHQKYFPLQFHYSEKDLKNGKDVDKLLGDIISRRNLPVYMRNESGSIRYCYACEIIKPDRTHHCSTCETCTLKMDHHCVIVQNCIGLYNQKAFILLLFYGIILNIFYTGSIIITMSNTLWNIEAMDMIMLVMGMIASVCIAVPSTVLWSFHIYNVYDNCTTLERLRDPVFSVSNISYDNGFVQNFIQVFGYNFLLWLTPIFSSTCNGYEWKIREL